MQGPSWVALLRRLPTALHETLILVTNTAIEVVVQNIIRLEREFVIVRGRMAGSQDTGRIIFVPYDQITYAGLTKKLTDEEVRTALGRPGNLPPAVVATAPMVAAAGVVAQDDGFEAYEPEQLMTAPKEEASAEPGADAAAAAGPAKPAPPSKTVLLARLRARLANDGAHAPTG